MKNNNTILEVIKNRRTVRHFSSKAISKNIVKKLIDAARWAPCPNNLQSWRFFAAKKGSEINARVISYLNKRTANQSIGVSIFVKDAIRILKTAPIIIYVFNTRIVMRKYQFLGKHYQACANLFEHQAVSAAIENMVLLAEDLSIGTVWLGSPVFLKGGIERLFDPDLELCAVLGLGYYDAKPRKTLRLEVDDILKFVE